MKKKGNVDVITMGCSKNLVDSERLLKLFSDNGYSFQHDPEKAKNDIVVINTCGFIGDAKQESINMILQFADAKSAGLIRKLVVMGCLSERYLDELKQEIPEIDQIYGKFDWKKLLTDLDDSNKISHKDERIITSPSHYAYIKVSEGCNRTCSFCAIPIITGKHTSRTIEEIVEEVRQFVALGVKEFQVIAQDLSYYGVDIYKKSRLAELIEAMAQVEGVEWIRLHYLYPAGFPFDILDVMKRYPNVCNYLDMAFQHVSDTMLGKMRRNFTAEQTYDLIDRIRAEVPGIHLRTTLLTGYPGETEADFDALVDFVDKVKFDRLGVFSYSEEEDTFGAQNHPDDIDEETKNQRVEVLMKHQAAVAFILNEAKIGSVQKVIIDRKDGDYFVGRTQFDSPEVDPEVLVLSEKPLKIGDFYTVRITGCEDYDLVGEIC